MGIDGYCVHLNRETYRCEVHDKRPVPCRGFDCKENEKWKVWLDYDLAVLNELSYARSIGTILDSTMVGDRSRTFDDSMTGTFWEKTAKNKEGQHETLTIEQTRCQRDIAGRY